MSFCDFVPDDESCQTTPTGPDNNNSGGQGNGQGQEMEDDMGMDAMMGNLTYLHVAMGGMIHMGLELFRYQEDNLYDNGDYASTNLWKMSSQLVDYSCFAISSVLFVTQLLSMLGIAGEINIMAWMYGHAIEMIIGMIVQLVRLYAYDAAWSYSKDTSNTAANIAKAVATQEGIEFDGQVDMIMGTAMNLALAMEHKNWMHAQVMALPEEAQMKYMHGKKHGGHDDDMEMLSVVQKYTGFFGI